MDISDLMMLAQEAMMLVLILSLPTIVAASLVGTLVSLIQALTQIQEQTLGFVLKLVAVIFALLATGSWMGAELINLGATAFKSI
ncbi:MULTISPECIES: type III secretion system export apparatus subunit SctS [Microbulbifer]|uniref:type III secretion system export apparatus subunit SctS n=1 Tax=Microbulbifer TaxID=48073 RepID=UPI001CFE1333|nr:type III secretion system export apparatus subunit SctS [Microbulbifer variabilis]